MKRRMLTACLLAALVGFAFGWLLLDYSERHGVSALPWLNHDWKKP